MQDYIIRAVCVTLLHSLWQAVLLAAVAGTLLMLTRRAGSALRYKLLCTLMLVFVAAVVYTFCVQVTASQHAGRVSANSLSSVYRNSNASLNSTQLVADSRISILLNACTYLFNQYSWLLVLVWFVFFLVRFLRLLLVMVNVDRMRYYKTNIVSGEWEQGFEQLCSRMHILQPVLLMESALLKVPVLIGYLKPVILIPAGMLTQLSADQVEVILLHELAHVRRHDYMVNLVQSGIDTIFFFNPALLWISDLIRSERECCCDDIAIRETKNKQQFIQALISFNQYSSTLNTCSLSWLTGKGQLLRRVQRIVTKKNSSLRSAELVALLSVVLFGSSAFVIFQHNQGSYLSGIGSSVAPKKISISKQPVARAKSGVNPSPKINTITAKTVAGTTVRVSGATLLKKQVITKKPIAVVANIPAARPPAVPSVLTALGSEPPDSRVAEDLADLQRQLAALGYREDNAERLQTFRDHGVSPSFIKSFIEAGYKNVSLNQFLQLADHGVRAAFTNGLKERGYGTVSLERATDLVDHGVSLVFIEAFKKLGFSNITLEEAITLKDHGVSAAFIESFKNKTDRLLSLEDYIKIKDSGINRSS